MNSYIDINKKFWNDNTALHLESDFYDNASFIAGRSSLPNIDQALLPDITGKKLLHLQCHFGQDTLSLARLGADVTGVDFSNKAIESARKLSETINVKARFIECDILSLNERLGEEFDILYSSYGTIGWLPDINKWAQVIQQHLKKGGRFYFIEFHPFIWMYNQSFSEIEYAYFNVATIKEEIQGSYAAPEAKHKNNIISWNHTLSDVIQALLNTGLKLQAFQEYDYSPYDIFQDSIQIDQGYQIKGQEGNLPLVYSVIFEKC